MATSITNRVKELRTAQGWTQEQLAQAIGVSRQSINSIERDRYVPSLELALKFAETAENPLEAARSATQKLFDDSLDVIGSETNQFFTTVKFPEISRTN